jgi:lytic murein transglycosylase
MRKLWLTSALIGFLPLLSGQAIAQSAPSKQATAAQNAAFHAWLKKEIFPEAKANGISTRTLEQTLGNRKLNLALPDVLLPGQKQPKEQKQTQAEFSSPAGYFNEKRLQGLTSTGRSLAATHAQTLKRIEAKYGVPAPIILAVWGRESGFGRAKMPHQVFDVLATKAYATARKDYFRKELLAALEIVERGHIAPDAMYGSWAGALGQPQFMPSSYIRHAVDFDGDGKADIWNSVPDSLASIASYLYQRGWQAGRDWGFEVSIPQNVSCAQEGPDLAKPIGEWANLGINRITGKAFPRNEQKAAGMMLVPAGRYGPEFIVTPNFYVIKEYNNSDLYALFIGNLADRIGSGGAAFKTQWKSSGPLLRSDVLKMQNALVKQGYDVGNADGLAGFKTRRSIGAWQAKNGAQPTCYPDPSMKSALR